MPQYAAAMQSLKKSLVIVASLMLVGACSLGSSSDDSDASSSSTSSTSSTEETQESEESDETEESEDTQETVTETESPSPTSEDTGSSATASVTGDTPDGSGESAPDAEQAVEDFGEAVKDEDFDAMCDAFDPEIVDAIEAEGMDCPSAFEDNWDEMGEEVPEDAEMDIRGSELSQDGKSATVTVKNDEGQEQDIALTKIGGDWKIHLNDM